MIRLRDTTMLALTKLRTRKVRLTITVVISGLLFSFLMGASLVARGAFASLESFSKEGLGKRYIVSGNDNETFDVYGNKDVVARAQALQQDLIARKKADATRLGIEYDPTSEPQAVNTFNIPGGGTQQNLAPDTPAGKQAIQEYLAAHPLLGASDFQHEANQYSADAFYISQPFPYSVDGSLQVLENGKESFTNTQQKGQPDTLQSFTGNWSLMSSGLLKPFVLKNESLGVGTDGSIPMVIPVSAAEKLINLPALSATASPAEKLNRTKNLRQKIRDFTFTMCYRNPTSQGLIDQANQVQQQADQNKGNKDYKQPDLVYGLPSQACGVVPVIRDVRTDDQKAQDAKMEQFQEDFGKPAATQATIAFRVVGVVPDPVAQNAAGVNQIISSMVTSSLGGGWYTPLEAAQKQPLLSQFFDPTRAALNGARAVQYAEFGTATQAQQFIDKANCRPDYAQAAKNGFTEDPVKQCVKDGKPFALAPFGSNSLAVESLRKNFGNIFRLAALGVALIGAIIMMGTVGRLIADSRRETAVFRAIGAKKLDIAQIYLFYTLLLALLVALFACIIGVIAAVVTQHLFSSAFTVQALVAYNAQDLNQTFKLFAFYWPDVLYLAGIAVVTGLLSAAVPLARNLRRNPIRDMRDDT